MKRETLTYFHISPTANLVYLLYNHHFNLVPSGSGALRVENPNQLESLITDEISVAKDGFMHMGACPERLALSEAEMSHSAEGVEWVSNGSANKGIYFDNSCGERSRTILVTMLDGSTRQVQWVLGDARSPYSHASRQHGTAGGGVINHCGSSCACAPDIADGLRIAGLDGYSHDYKNMYTSKELQTEEFHSSLSTGLEMPAPSGHATELDIELPTCCVTFTGYDFIRACPLSAVLMRPLRLVHARFYDPQLGRWFAPDPAEQFHNPYLAMGNNPATGRESVWMMYVDPDGREIVTIAIIIGATIGAYIGGSVANDGQLNPVQWNWNSGHTWAGMGIGAVFGAAGGYGFAVGGPALAGTSFFTNFGLSGSVAAYTLAGGVSMGVAGYGAGFGSAMLRSKGNWNYSHQAGMFGLQVGASIGSVAGGIYGFAQGVDFSMPEFQKPEYKWNGELTASSNGSTHIGSHSGPLSNSSPTPDDLRRIYQRSYNEFQDYLINPPTGLNPFSISDNYTLAPDPFYLGNFPYLTNVRASVNHISYMEAYNSNFSNPFRGDIGNLVWPKGGEPSPYFTYPGYDSFFNGLNYFKMRIQWWIPPMF